MQRFHTLLIVLTMSVACGSGSSGPKTAPEKVSDKSAGVVKMSATTTTPIVPADAAIPPPPPPPPAPPPEPPKLACADGETSQAAPFPDPTWYCVRADGVKHGAFFTLFPDLTIAIEGTYANGKLEGKWTRHYPGGALAEEGQYVKGLPDGVWQQLAADGSKLGEYKLKAGTGKMRRWYDDGPLYSEYTLKKGVPAGAFFVKTRDGAVVITGKQYGTKYDDKHQVGAKNSLRIEETFTHGTRTGARQIWQFWALLIDETYDGRGKLDGGFTIWRDKKIPRVQGTYDHGKKVGTWIWTDKNNNREREGDFLDGKKSGTWNEYTDTTLTFSGNFTDGKPDGDFVYYDKTGAEMGRYTMHAGDGVAVTFHTNKKPSSRTVMRGGLMNGKYEELTPRGKQLVEGFYSGDRKTGTWREWNDMGVLQSEIHWKRGRLDGSYKKLTDGVVSVEATYKDGKADGTYTEYKAGKPVLTGQFANDRRTGTWTMLTDGKETLTATYKDGVLDGPWREVVRGEVIEGTLVAGRRSGSWTTAKTP